MFNEQTIRELSGPLDSRQVSSRSQGGRSFDYIQGWQVADNANRIFGFGNWSREITDLRLVDETERRTKEGELTGKWDVSYIATVKVDVFGDATEGVPLIGSSTHSGTGCGHGLNQAKGAAHESAVKEAETDAMKRALSFGYGNQFGLACYAGKERYADPVQWVKYKNELEDELGVPRKSVSSLAELIEYAEQLKNQKLDSSHRPMPEPVPVGGEEAQASVDQATDSPEDWEAENN